MKSEEIDQLIKEYEIKLEYLKRMKKKAKEEQKNLDDFQL